MSYSVELQSSARRSLGKLTPDIQGKIHTALQALSEDPFSSTHDVKKLSGSSEYRLRVGDYRIIYEIAQQKLLITVIRVANRRDAYR